jgi:hypothetical protein
MEKRHYSVKSSCIGLLCALLLVGCATSTVETRKKEREAAYATLPLDQQELVSQGKIRIGMSPDAVYIAWGPPSEVLEQQTPQGHHTIWIYHAQWVQEYRYWAFREVPHKGTVFLERVLETDYYPRSYIQAEIVFQDGVVLSWRTLPRPLP